MKRIYFLLFFILCNTTKPLYAQPFNFNRIYDSTDIHHSTFFTSVFHDDVFIMGGIKWSPYQVNPVFPKEHLQILLMDSNFNVKKNKIYTINNYPTKRTTNIKVVKNTIYLLGFYHKDYSPQMSYGFILKTNLNLDSLDLIEFGDSATLGLFPSDFVHKDGYLYALSPTIDSAMVKNKFKLVKMDTTGNTINTWTFGGTGYSVANNIKKTKDKGFIIGGYSNSYRAGIFDLFLIKLDSAGNIEWEKSYPSNNDQNIGTSKYLAQTNDEGYVLLGEEKHNGNYTIRTKATLLKTDSLGNIQWRKPITSYTSNYTRGLQITNDGNILICGQGEELNNNYNYNYLSFIKKINTLTGKIIWQKNLRYSQNPQFQHKVESMKVSPTGDIVTNGTVFVFDSTNYWLVKFDSCGYTVGATPQALLAIDSTFGGKVFINHLSQDYCTAKLLLQKNDSSFIDSLSIYAYSQYSNGANPKQIQYTFTDTGTYQITLYTYAGNAIDTFTTSIFIASTDTSTHIHSVDLPALNCAVYPNPAQNFLLLAFEQASHSHLEAVLYNASGHLVKTFALKPEKVHHQLNLDNISTGLYFLQVKHQKQILKTKKVSIVK